MFWVIFYRCPEHSSAVVLIFIKTCSLKCGMEWTRDRKGKLGGMETLFLSSELQLYFRSLENKDNAFVLGKESPLGSENCTVKQVGIVY